jgi:hypothetical protein
MLDAYYDHLALAGAVSTVPTITQIQICHSGFKEGPIVKSFLGHNQDRSARLK